MADPQAAKRYAQAAFAIAMDEGPGALGRWRADLDDIASVLAESGLSPTFADGRTLVADRQAMAARALDIQPLALNLARLLIAKGRALDARFVEQAFGKMADEQEGLAQAQITTAVELTADQLASIEERLGVALNRRVTTTAVVDPTILGGIIVRVGDQLLDGSIRTRLRRLRRELMAG